MATTMAAAAAASRKLAPSDRAAAAGLPVISALAFQATVSFITGNWDDAAPGLEAGLLLGQEQGNRVLVNQWNGCERGRGDPPPWTACAVWFWSGKSSGAAPVAVSHCPTEFRRDTVAARGRPVPAAGARS